VRVLPSRIPIHLALLLAIPAGLWAVEFPGHVNALMATPQSREFIWINPANLNLADDSTGVEAGYAYAAGTNAFSALLHLPHGISAGFGHAQDYLNGGQSNVVYGRLGDIGDPYTSSTQDEPAFLAMALAKRGFGSERWLSGLSLGLATRRYAFSGVLIQPTGSEIGSHGTFWSLDGGLAWDLPPWEGLGKLHLGVYALQISTASSADRLIGTQWQWWDQSGIWDVEANLILSNPGKSDPINPHTPEPDTSFPAHRVALSFHLGIFDFGGQVLPARQLAAGPMVRLNIPTHTVLRNLSLEAGAYFWSKEGSAQSTGNLGIRATFHAPRAPGDHETYAEYRKQKPAGAIASASVPVDTSVAPPEILDQASWEKRRTWYQDQKIGVWRGTVWPYVNTFGFYTTFFVPAGTSCLAVGDYLPGFVLLGGWAAIFTYNTFGNGSTEKRAAVYALGQIGFKLTDLVLSQVYVHKYNRSLRERLRITALPMPGGLAYLASLDF